MPIKTVRLQFEIPEDRLQSLDELMEEAGIKTRTELFNNAMTLLRWAVRHRKEGHSIASINHEDKSITELEMPIFQNVESKVPSSKNARERDE